MQDIILTTATRHELVAEISKVVLEGIDKILAANNQKIIHSKEWLTSKETEQILKISSVTRWNWTNSGILKSHKIGNSLRFRQDEVLEALLRIESKR